MKRLTALGLILALCLSLAACAGDRAVTYYYIRDPDEYQYGSADAVMAGERREAAGQVDDLHHLLVLYFHGPVSDNLRSPFPSGTKLEEVVRQEDSLELRLNSMASLLDGADLTLACGCLAQTCFDLTDVQSVTILAEGMSTVSMTISRDSLLLTDDTTIPAAEESE